MLIRPVIEGGGADDESKVPSSRGSRSAVPVAKRSRLSAAAAWATLIIARHVDPDQLERRRNARGKPAHQVAGPAPDVEDALRGRHAVQGKAGGAVGDLMMQRAAPAVLVSRRALGESCDITVTGHTRSWHLRHARAPCVPRPDPAAACRRPSLSPEQASRTEGFELDDRRLA